MTDIKRRNKIFVISTMVSLVMILFLVVGATYSFDIPQAIRTISTAKGIEKSKLFTRVTLLWILFSVAIMHIIYDLKFLYGVIYKYRYYIAFGAFILGMLLQLNGSSISQMSIGLGQETEGLVFGTPRSIRSDEWATFTPMILSQKYNNYSRISEIIRGDYTDTFIVYGLPSWDIFTILFRPFLIGFMVLKSAGGLSFFWVGRFIVLLMVSFEGMMLLTDKNKKLSLVGAIMITLSPVVQWWFAINGFVEMLIFTFLSILMLDKYMTTKDFKKRCIYLFVIYVCAGGYIMTFYPALMFPLAYVIVGLAIWVIIKNYKECTINKKDVISIIITALAVVLSIGYIFLRSRDTIETVMNTAYPGKRVATGGGYIEHIFKYCMNIFMPFREDNLKLNTCESATFFDMYPLGLIISLIVILKEKKKDILLIILNVLQIILFIYAVFGFNEILAKITMLGNTTSGRTYTIISFLNVLILIRALAVTQNKLKWQIKVIIAAVVTVLMSVGTIYTNKEYLTIKMRILMIVMLLVVYMAIMLYDKISSISAMIMSIIVILSGIFVNPIQIGTGSLYTCELSQKIEQYASNGDKWIVESLGYPLINYPIMFGASTINSTNVYPDIARWEELDTNKENLETYNRYSHIWINIDNDTNKDKFNLIGSDYMQLTLKNEDIKQLEVGYILTARTLEEESDKDVSYECVYTSGNYRIYKVNYK